MPALLAVDTGLKFGLALYGEDGRLCAYRSHHLGSAAGLKRRVRGLLEEWSQVAWLVLEGGGPLADVWEREAQRRGIRVRRVSAESWRRQLLYPREQANGWKAKRAAADMARRVIVWSGAPRPTSLRHDAAEAILIGLWGVLDVGWLEAVPGDLRR